MMNKIGVEKKKQVVSIFDRIIDFIFSNDYRKWLLLIVFFGFLFRLINVKNRLVSGDSPHFMINSLNFLNSGLLSLWGQSSFLWYAFTDIFFRIFGVTQFTSRFSSLLFGTATIIVMYLFVKEFSGNKKIALISALIYAFAPAFIFHTTDEQDISTLFFIITTFYYLIKGLNNKSKKYLIFSGVLFGVASMWKAYVPILIIPYLGFILYYAYTKRFDLKKEYKTIIYILIIIFLLASPTVVYNYSNTKHNGVPTFFFVKFFGGGNVEKINNLYGWVSGGELSKDSVSLKKIFIEALKGFKYSLGISAPILWGMSILGLIWMFIKRNKHKFAKDYLVFFSLYFLIPYILIINSNTLSKHYLNFLAMAVPIIAYLIYEIFKYLINKFTLKPFLKKNLILLLILLILFQFFIVLSIPFQKSDLFFSQNPENKLINYKLDNIPENSLIIYDERIYNSLAGWLFNDRYFISTVNYGKFMEYNKKSNNKKIVPVFIVECGIGECGWASNSQLNNFSNSFFSSVKSNSIPLVFKAKKQFSKKGYFNPLISEDKEKNYTFLVYKTQMSIDLDIANSFKQQYNYFMYPLNYENKEQTIFKNFIYTPDSIFEIIINKFAWLIFYLEIIISFFILFQIIYELYLNND